MNDRIKTVQLLEHQARLAFALGELDGSIACSICNRIIAGSGAQNHSDDCLLSTAKLDTKETVQVEKEKPELNAKPTRKATKKRKRNAPKHEDAKRPATNSERRRVNGRFARAEPEEPFLMPGEDYINQFRTAKPKDYSWLPEPVG